MEPKPTLKVIEERLTNIRASIRAEAAVDAKSKLVEEFENVSLITTIENPLECKAFLDAYIINLIKQYLHDKSAQEILFVAYGLLEDFTIDTEKEIDKRRIEYFGRAVNNTYIVSRKWETPHKSLYKKEKKFIAAISKEIEHSINNKEGDDWHLNLGEEVASKLVKDFPGGIPEQYPLPKPQFIPNYTPRHVGSVPSEPRLFAQTVVEDQDIQDELDDSTEALPDSTQEEAAAVIKNPESPQSVKSETFSPEETQSDATEKPPQILPKDMDGADPSSQKGNDYVIESHSNDSHDMNMPIVNIYINSAQDDPPIPDIIEPAPPSIEYLTPETPPQPVPHPAMESLSIVERLKRLFRRNTHAKKDKTPCHAKKCLAGVIAAVLALVAIILLCTAVWPRSNMYTWPIPTSYPGNDPYSMPEQYIIPAPIEGLSFLGNTNVGLTISPGCRVPLPITVIPEESSNAYLTLDSSDGNIVRAYDIKREIEAIENPDVTEPLRSVTITVRPLPSDAASPSIELQIPVLVDYQTDSEDITQKPVMGPEKTTGSIAEPLS